MVKINKNSLRAEVLAAVQEDGYALKKAHPKFRDDKKIIMASIKWSPQSIEYASDRLKDNKQIAIQVLKLNGNMLKYFSKKIKNNNELVQIAYKDAGEDALNHAHISIRKKLLDEAEAKYQKSKKNAEYKTSRELKIQEIKESNFDNWYSVNSKYFKSRKALSNLLDQKKLEAILKNNLKIIKEKKINNLFYGKGSKRELIIGKNGLTDPIYQSLVPKNIDSKLFYDYIDHNLLIYSFNDYIDAFNILDILCYSKFEVTFLTSFSMKFSALEHDVKSLLYFNLEIAKHKNYLIKLFVENSDAANPYDEMIVIKQGYEYINQDLLNFIFKNALKIDSSEYPWNRIELNAHLNYDKNLQFNQYENVAKKIAKKLLRNEKDENIKKLLNNFDHYGYSTLVKQNKPLYKPSNTN